VQTSQTSNYTATSADDLIPCNANGGAFTVTLPAANAFTGKVLRIVKTDSSLANAVTVARAGSDTINGATSTTLNTQYEMITLISDGSAAWYIIGRTYPTSWTAWTPTVAGTTFSNNASYWRRNGSEMEVSIFFQTTTTSGSTITISLPTGATTDNTAGALTTAAGRMLVGVGACNGDTVNMLHLTAENNATVLKVGYENATTNWSDVQAGNVAFTNGAYVGFKGLVPINGWN
jgi:hypothetical protein